MIKPQGLQQLEQATLAELGNGVMAFRTKAAERREANRQPPAGWRRPAYNTPEFWQAYGYGWITDEQAEEAEQRGRRARASLGTLAQPPARWGRGEPQDSRQYANPMATTAARDNRLTPQAKALLQVLRARCGTGLETSTTKTTLAAIIGRHVRTVQRYIQELVRFGYITAEIRRNRIGSHIGLIVRLCQKVLPFWKDDSGLAEWLWNEDRKPETSSRPGKGAYPFDSIGRTEMPPINYSPNQFLISRRFSPLLAGFDAVRGRRTA